MKPYDAILGWHYLSHATRLMRPSSLYVFRVASITIIICYIIRRLEEHLC